MCTGPNTLHRFPLRRDITVNILVHTCVEWMMFCIWASAFTKKWKSAEFYPYHTLIHSTGLADVVVLRCLLSENENSVIIMCIL